MNSAKRPGHHLLDGTIRVFLAEGLLFPTGLLTATFLSRSLGPANYGLFTLSITLVGGMEWIITSIFARSAIKFVGEAEDWRPVGAAVVRLHLLVSVGAMLLFYLLAEPLAALLQEPTLAVYLRLCALDIPLFSLAQGHRVILIGLGGFGQRALASAGRWIFRLLFIILLVGLGLSVPGAILGHIGASLVELVISRYYIRPSMFRRSDFPLWQMWGYTLPIFLFTLSQRLFDKLDLWMLKGMGGTAEQAGIYSAAQNLAMVFSMLALSFSPLLLSTLSRTLRAGEFGAAKQVSRQALRATFLTLPIAGLIAGAAAEIIGLIFTPTFSPAAALLAWLSFGALAVMVLSVSSSILIAAGKPGWTFALGGPLLLLAGLGHYLLIPRLGAEAASAVTAVCAWVGALASVAAVYRIWRVLPPAGTCWRSICVCVMAYTLAAVWPTPGWLLLAKLPILGLGIGLSFLFLGEFTMAELAAARALFRWPATAHRGAVEGLKND
jgi:O-antigen/teichoic acid export membrane protein